MKISITEKFYFWIIENKFIRNVLILFYKLGKKIPWTLGYYEYKWKSIKYSLQDSETIKSFKTKSLPSNYGKFLDERIVEYSWAFVNLNNNRTNLLDAGSILNFSQILEQKKISNKNLTICTYYP